MITSAVDTAASASPFPGDFLALLLYTAVAVALIGTLLLAAAWGLRRGLGSGLEI